MQIDFHHATTYVLARMAGFNNEEAEKIAYAAQYVDDATHKGEIKFSNGAMYERGVSAHKMLDYRNHRKLANHKVWMPFHFLPGNDGKPCDYVFDEDKSFIERLVCKPDSDVAKDVLEACITDAKVKKPYALQRLGITMHVYADTLSHQGFAGKNHKINEVHNINLKNETDEKGKIDYIKKLKIIKENIINFVLQPFIGEVFPLGHGPALSHPDKPYLKWSYTNGLGQHIERNNPADFLTASQLMVGAMMQYRAELGLQVPDGSSFEDDWNKLLHNFENIRYRNGEKRHEEWLDSIKKGDFSFGPIELSYHAKGESSLIYKVLGVKNEKETKNKSFEYKNEFLKSDWKLFHDALLAHRFSVIHDILPKYGICIA